jgi:outer membrane protein OmpA-like peptidoglycan-associated protein
MTKRLDWPRYTSWTWIIALWALAALVWMWASGSGSKSANCCVKPVVEVVVKPLTVETVTETQLAPAHPSATTQPWVSPTSLVQNVNAVLSGNKITLNGVVGTNGTKKAMLAAAASKFGDGNVIDKLTVDRSVKITLTGEVDSDAIKAKRGTEAQAFYPGTTVDNQLIVKLRGKADVATPIMASKNSENPTPATAVSKVNTDVAPPSTVSTTAVVARPTDASKVQCGENIVIAANFAKGSGRLSPEMAKVLEAVVPCIKGRYEIGGHTDNIGEDDKNQVLSQRRAKTVANFLIENGVNAKLLKPKGYGEAAPIGDNSTEEGRIKNRRIEFKKM